MRYLEMVTRSGALLLPVLLLACGRGQASAPPVVDGLVDGPGARRELALDQLRSRTPEGMLAAVVGFEEVLARDPGDVRSWAGLAEASALLGLYSVVPPAETMPRAEAAAERALELDDGDAVVHAAHGLARYLYRWDFDAAETSFERAIELDPELASARHWYAMMLSALGRHEQAVVQIEAALRAEPASRLLQVKTATVLHNAGLFEQAARQLEAALAEHGDYAMAYRELGTLRLRQGRLADARLAFERAAEIDGGIGESSSKSSGGLGYTLARLGYEEQARAIADELARQSRQGFVPPLAEALVRWALGERELALVLVERALEIHDPGLVYVAVKPGWRELAGEPRFDAVLAAVGLPAVGLAVGLPEVAPE